MTGWSSSAGVPAGVVGDGTLAAVDVDDVVAELLSLAQAAATSETMVIATTALVRFMGGVLLRA